MMLNATNFEGDKTMATTEIHSGAELNWAQHSIVKGLYRTTNLSEVLGPNYKGEVTEIQVMRGVTKNSGWRIKRFKKVEGQFKLEEVGGWFGWKNAPSGPCLTWPAGVTPANAISIHSSRFQAFSQVSSTIELSIDYLDDDVWN